MFTLRFLTIYYEGDNYFEKSMKSNVGLSYIVELFSHLPFVITLTIAVFAPFIVWLITRGQGLKTLAKQEQSFLVQCANFEQNIALAEQAKSLKEQELAALEQQNQSAITSFNQQISSLRAELVNKEKLLSASQQKLSQYDVIVEQNASLSNDITRLNVKLTETANELESQKAVFHQERKAFEEKLSLLKNAEQQLNVQFENLANKIFEQKAEKFSQTSQSGLNQLLSPLKTQIDDFKKQISDQYLKEGQERAALKTEILGLKELNLQITQEASALTNALKGDNKQQGNWGEVVLSKILDESGLREGHEYEVQKHLTDQSGKRFRPDVVVHLPSNKDIVIDSKVSLVAHEKVVNAETDNQRIAALKEHVASVKGHIKGLSKKDYQDLEGVNTLDYVLMFIPIEAAFLNAVEAEPDLIKLALDNQIMLVSPTNLLVALRTINNIWQYEYQNQHAKTIADKAKRMYEKFANFVEDMEKIGKNIDNLSKSYDASMNKLSQGKGNLIRQAESFKQLGVTPNKSIKQEWLSEDQDENT